VAGIPNLKVARLALSCLNKARIGQHLARHNPRQRHLVRESPNQQHIVREGPMRATHCK
jgi:hypothetical protein